MLLAAILLLLLICLLTGLALKAFDVTDLDLHNQKIGVLVWRQRRNFIGVIYAGGIAVLLLGAALLGERGI